jgi:DNA-binding HxlR family transcriptional regulator
MPASRPGRPVRGSQTGRPIMALLDLLGRRWILRILWELRGQPLGFRELQRRCESVSPSVLSLRVKDLAEAGILAVRPEGTYELTPEGQRLLDGLAPLHDWAVRWSKRGHVAG